MKPSARFVAVMWNSFLPLLRRGAGDLGVRVDGFTTRALRDDPGRIRAVAEAAAGADLVLLYRTADDFWTELDEALQGAADRGAPVVCVGPDPSNWRRFDVPLEVSAEAQVYVAYNGEDNFRGLTAFLLRRVLGRPVDVSDPRPVPWEGVFHPDLDGPFDDLEAYLAAYPLRDRPLVGILTYRQNWVSGDLGLETLLVRELEARGLGVVPVFYYSSRDEHAGNLGGVGTVERFLFLRSRPAVRAVVKLNAFFLGSGRGGADDGVDVLARLGVPVFQPVIAYGKDRAAWEASAEGLGSELGWSVAMPEFEGVIEPILVATAGPDGGAGVPVEDRVARLAARVRRWVDLALTPPAERRVALVLNNDPCASVEATVGGAAKLDSLESAARVLGALEAAGYRVDGRPPDGEALIREIMDRKAVSEFRFTTVDEIVARGGVLGRVPADRYRRWFDALPEPVRRRLVEVWGEPPGTPKDGVPAAMVHRGDLVITGVRYGNAVVLVQPKRGCAGSRCDGQVCRILHDPTIPPPHHYIATYRYLQEELGVHAVIHVGTHGTLEFLPGKNAGLSAACLPDVAAGELPCLYIYNADNPPEGVVAKRRGLAALVDHLQTVMVPSGLYGELEELDREIAEWRKVRGVEPGRAHQLQHRIERLLQDTGLVRSLRLPDDAPFEERVQEAHDALTLIRDSWIRDGMHVFGTLPRGERRADFLFAVLQYDDRPGSLRGVVRDALDAAGRLPEDPEQRGRAAREAAREVLGRFLARPDEGLGRALGPGTPADPGLRARVEALEDRIRDVAARLDASDEMGSLLRGLAGGYVRPGASGIVTRGRDDVLPTGRNFYTLDPRRIPSPAAHRIGQKLAEAVIRKHLDEEGRYPDGVGVYWQCNDILWADGEGMAYMMALIGVEPVWGRDGRVRGVRVIPLGDLGRPRIDVTVRVSGILRDNFPHAIELLDEALQTVASLDEPPDRNHVRRHALERAAPDDPAAWRRATYRIFASPPGTYQAGTQLAVYASAWKEDKDLSDVFLYWNGYAYGKGVRGVPAHASLRANLGRVDLTFNKVVTDESDLLGCCGYYGAHGGMTAAARVVSGRPVRAYYGDTREAGKVAVRDLAEELRRVVRTNLLNPRWIEGMKRHGYKGAGDISKRVGRVYGWQATARAVDDEVFDAIARTFVMDDENRAFFEEHNPWALEEMARRLLEAEARGLWRPDPEVADALRNLYLEIEGWIEDAMEGVEGSFQGGSVDVVAPDEVASWRAKLRAVLGEEGG